jgi:uncharacterized protein (TIGR02594 family)
MVTAVSLSHLTQDLKMQSWIKQAKRLKDLGIHEIPGKRNNADIMYMAKVLNTWYPNDETAWCGLFVAYCLYISGYKTGMPDNILGAKRWGTYGVQIKPSEVTEGDILVFWRGTPKGAYGHVGFYLGETKDAYLVLGGNHGNSISEVWVSKKRLVSIRRPKGAKAGPKGKVATHSTGTLSTNEG